MSRTLEINPVTRIEGHARVQVELGDDNTVRGAWFSVLEFRGFERFVQGMQVELLPTLTTRICGTCPHAHHLVAAKCVDRVFGVEVPRPARLLRELLNAASIIHSHAIHFFALAGPDLLLGLDRPAAERNLVGLLASHPELTKKALRLRSIGQKMAELVGGRGTHPVAAVGGGMASPLNADQHRSLSELAAEGLELAQFALSEGCRALENNRHLLGLLARPTHVLGTVRDGQLDLYEGTLRVRTPEGTTEREFAASDYAEHLVEQALAYSYGKEIRLQDRAGGPPFEYQVGPLARLGVADRIETPRAGEALAKFKDNYGTVGGDPLLAHQARLIELLYCAEKAVALLADPEILSPQVRVPMTGRPRRAVAHIEAPRGVLIHDYDVDSDGRVTAANFLVATQHNLAAINASVRMAAEKLLGRSDEQLLDGVELAIRCYDPCLSCSTHQLGQMPMVVTFTRQGQVLRSVRR